MRVLELFEDTPFTQTQARVGFSPDPSGRQQRSRFLGGGLYSNVYRSISDPQQVVKRNIYPSILEKDAYYQYVRYIFNRINRNPYLPRVTRVAIKTDASGAERPEYRLERLQKWAKFDPEVIVGIATRVFPPLESILDRRMASGDLRNMSKDEIAETVWEFLINQIKVLAGTIENHYNQNFHSWARTQARGRSDAELHTEFFTREYPKILQSFKAGVTDDPNLFEALAIIAHLQAINPDIATDFHAHNFMIRPTPTGPQLVFVDPVQDAGKSQIRPQ
jgi:hypothetical protein